MKLEVVKSCVVSAHSRDNIEVSRILSCEKVSWPSFLIGQHEIANLCLSCEGGFSVISPLPKLLTIDSSKHKMKIQN